MIFSTRSKIIITFAIFSLATALAKPYDGYGAPMPPPIPAPPVPNPIAPTPIAPIPIVPTPIAPTPIAPTPIVPTPIVPTPIVPTPIVPTLIVPTTIASTPIAPTPTPPPEPQAENFIQVLKNKGNFKQLIEAITDLDLIEKLDNLDAKTIFAPNDAAFAKLTDADFKELTDPEKITIIKR